MFLFLLGVRFRVEGLGVMTWFLSTRWGVGVHKI